MPPSRGRIQEPFQRISVKEGKRFWEGGKALFVDVRRPDEWVAGHIPGAVHIPVDDFLARYQEIAGNEDKEVVFVCAQGVRSALACEMAAAVGFNRLYNLEGGTEAWQWENYPIQTGKEPGVQPKEK